MLLGQVSEQIPKKRNSIFKFIISSGLRLPIKDQPTTSPIFFYAVTCHGTKRSFAVAQMLSQLHTIEWIRLWLSIWLEDNHLPDEVIIDESAALMGAVISAFTQFETTNDYISACTGALLGDSELPRTFVRIDRSHFVESIIRNVCKGFQKTITCSDYKEAANIIYALFTVICNEFISPCVEECVNLLRQLVGTHNVDEFNVLIEKVKNEDPKDIQAVWEAEDVKINIRDKSLKKTLSYGWVQNILKSIKISDEKEKENMYFAPEYKKYLLRTFVRLPLWSNIMLEKFSSRNTCATSSPSENTFKEIKKLLNLTKKKRVDVLVDKNISKLSGHLKIGVAHQKNQSALSQMATRKRRSASTDGPVLRKRSRPSYFDEKSIGNTDSNISIDTNSECESTNKEQPVENWRNKNVQRAAPIVITKEKRRSQRSILSKHDCEYFRSGLTMLKNGYDTSKLATEYTCSFDSIYVIFGIACLEYKSAEAKYLNTDSLFSQFLQEVVKGKKRTTEAYQTRNDILDKNFSSEYYSNSENIKIDNHMMKLINCHTGDVLLANDSSD